MDDTQIVSLYWNRSEDAIAETHKKYGPYCYRIAYNILTNNEDAEESVNDTYLTAWRAMPPQRPSILSAFLMKITRHISIDRWRERTAQKRGGGEINLALEELENCVADVQDVELTLQRREIIRSYIRFLNALPSTDRNVFLRRYWYLDSIGTIADKFGFSQSKVKSMLHRTRKKLRSYLAEEGLT